MKFIFLVIFALGFGNYAFAQSNKIVYYFPKKVSARIHDHISKLEQSLNEKTLFYCVVESSSDTTTSISIEFVGKENESLFYKTVVSSNRVLMLGDDDYMSIVFVQDFIFASYREDEFGRHKRVYPMFENPFRIQFKNRSGEIMNSEAR